VAGSSQEITQRRGKLEDEVGRKKEENIRVQEQKQLIVEELCGRDMGKRTFTITPTHQLSSDPMDLAVIIRNAEVIGFRIKTKGNLGLTAISSETGKNSNNINSSTLSVSFLTSGAATIVGAKSEQEALAIYREFADGKRLS
jgi:adenylyltransferase/sulfurtransferase